MNIVLEIKKKNDGWKVENKQVKNDF